ncbi:MAG: hypothetical protein ACYDHT_03740 [Solirubrobacteraceae bacterium]
MKQRLGQDFFNGQDSREVETTVTKDGMPVIHAGELWFFQEPETRELMVGRRSPAGAEFGKVEMDGAISWGQDLPS